MRNEVFRVGLWHFIFPELGMCLTQIVTTAAAEVGRAPWPARDAHVPLLEAGRMPQSANQTKRCQTVPA